MRTALLALSALAVAGCGEQQPFASPALATTARTAVRHDVVVPRYRIDINEAGQITGRMIDHVTKKPVGYIATPVVGN
ncbi:MAG TPA: hypothetical protein VH113_12960 [Gemmatimonadales bacterium]|nr:hypothetical protein [Gemmatimonadales bacterium]